jgi:hypothetical protein
MKCSRYDARCIREHAGCIIHIAGHRVCLSGTRLSIGKYCAIVSREHLINLLVIAPELKQQKTYFIQNRSHDFIVDHALICSGGEDLVKVICLVAQRAWSH